LLARAEVPPMRLDKTVCPPQYSAAESHQVNLRSDDTIKIQLNELLYKNGDIRTDSITFMGN